MTAMELIEIFSDRLAAKIVELFAKKTDLPKVMKGATAEKAGESGLAPAPKAGEEGKYLRGDGTYAEPSNADTFPLATQEENGIMSAGDKRKLDEIMEGDAGDIDRILAGTFEAEGDTPEAEIAAMDEIINDTFRQEGE